MPAYKLRHTRNSTMSFVGLKAKSKISGGQESFKTKMIFLISESYKNDRHELSHK